MDILGKLITLKGVSTLLSGSKYDLLQDIIRFSSFKTPQNKNEKVN